jgi:zinc protease
MRSPVSTRASARSAGGALPQWLARLGIACAIGCHAPASHRPPAAQSRVAVKQVALPDTERWRKTAPMPGADSPWTYPVPSVATLSNQMRVYVLQRPSGPVSLSLVIRHGASDVPPDKCGLASLTASLMAEATKTKNHHVLSEIAESLGSTLTGDANRDYVHLSLDTLAEDVNRGIDLLAETLTSPAFAAADFLRLRKQHLDDLVAERQNPSRLASLVGLRAILGERFGAPVGGRLSSIRSLAVEDVQHWHRRYAYPDAVALLVVGPVDASTVIASAENALGKLRGKRPNLDAPPTAHPADSTQVYLVDRPNSVQSAIFVAQTYPNRSAPGYAARQILDNIIGGQFTSRVNQNLREQHAYTYGAHSATVATRHFGLFAISTNVETDVTVPAVQEIVKELRELRGPNPLRPIGVEELERARTGSIQSLGSHLEDGHRLLLDLEQIFVHALPPTYLGDYLSEVRGLDGASLATESERLAPDHLSIVVVGDLSRVREQLETAGLRTTLTPPAWLD